MTPTRRGCLGWAALAAALVTAAPPGEASPRFRHRRPPFLYPGPFDYHPVPPFFPAPSGEPPLDYPENQIPQFVPEPSPAPANPSYAPYPQGFVLDVPTPTQDGGSDGQKPTGQLTRYRQVADALAQCWRPPSTFDNKPWGQITLRVSFKRDGSVNGLPRIPYANEGLTPDARSDLTKSLMAGLNRCTPLPLSPSLGNAIAGQIFALRFIQQEHGN